MNATIRPGVAKHLTRREMSVLLALVALADDRGRVCTVVERGVRKSSLARVAEHLSMSRSRVCNAIAVLRRPLLGHTSPLVRSIRRGSKANESTYLLSSHCLIGQSLFACPLCGTPGKSRGPRARPGAFCRTCQQGFRSDRAWHEQATELFLAGKSWNEIHVVTKQPILDDEVEQRGAKGEGIVPFLVKIGLVDRKTLHDMQAARRGSSSEGW